MAVYRSPLNRDQFYWFCEACGRGRGSSGDKAEVEKDWTVHQGECTGGGPAK